MTEDGRQVEFERDQHFAFWPIISLSLDRLTKTPFSALNVELLVSNFFQWSPPNTFEKCCTRLRYFPFQIGS